jgi:hypothetical protein
MDLYEELLDELKGRHWNRDGYVPSEVATEVAERRIHNLVRWLAEKAEALDGV